MNPIKNEITATVAIIGVLSKVSLFYGILSYDSKPTSLSYSSLLELKPLGDRLERIFS